jgi:hypothetical protein
MTWQHGRLSKQEATGTRGGLAADPTLLIGIEDLK